MYIHNNFGDLILFLFELSAKVPIVSFTPGNKPTQLSRSSTIICAPTQTKATIHCLVTHQSAPSLTIQLPKQPKIHNQFLLHVPQEPPVIHRLLITLCCYVPVTGKTPAIKRSQHAAASGMRPKWHFSSQNIES